MSVSGTTSDAARMDRHYRFQRHIYDATRRRYLIGRKHLIRDLMPQPRQSVLEIGSGTAWNLACIARAYPTVQCYGVDVSDAMLETAHVSIARKRLERRITLAQGDATSFEPNELFGNRQFDRVFFSYALSMIPAWAKALDHAAGFVAPGGSLHVVDFGQCEDLPKMFQAGLFAFLRHYEVTPRCELRQAVESCGAVHSMKETFHRLHRGYTHYAVLHRDM